MKKKTKTKKPRIKKKLTTLPEVIRSDRKNKDIGNFPMKFYRYSSFVKFSTNPIMFKIEYLNEDKLDTASSISSVMGSAFHRAMEVYYGGSEENLVTNEAEAIEFGLKAGMEYLEKYNDAWVDYSKTVPNKQKAFDVLSDTFRAYVHEKPHAGTGEIIGLEEEILETIDVKWKGEIVKMPVPLKGKVDKIIRDNGKLKIHDYKMAYTFSDPDKIDGQKIIQAIQYYFLVYAHTGEEPYSFVFEEVKRSKNKDGGKRVREYEIVYADYELFFEFYFRLYTDVTRALNGEMVYVPNVNAMYDNEIALISYIHRLDEKEEVAKLMKKHKIRNITELLKREIQSAGNMRKLLKAVEDKVVTAKNIDYSKMINEEKIQTKMLEHGMVLQFDSKIEGATVDLYRYTPSIGLKMARIRAYADDVEQVLGVSGIRILAPIPNTSLIGFEVPKAVRTFPALPKSKGYELAVGQTIEGQTRYFDIRQAPHMLVAGSTGSGKSVFLHSLIRQLMKLPKTDLHLFDPKQVELLQYEEDATEYKHSHDGIKSSLEDLVTEMEKRYTKMKKAKARNIEEIGGTVKFVVIDEYADLAMREQTGNLIKLLAQKGRAAGIHLIIATQRASTKVIDGDIKVNFPTKAIFRMSKEVDSRVMLDEPGAEKLLGKGDMLFATESGIERLQGYNASI